MDYGQTSVLLACQKPPFYRLWHVLKFSLLNMIFRGSLKFDPYPIEIVTATRRQTTTHSLTIENSLTLLFFSYSDF